MPYIDLQNELSGIRGLMAFRPDTAAPLSALAEILLRDTNGLSPAERELIATYVSYRNDCFYCHNSHGEIACYYLNGNRDIVDLVRTDYAHAPISDKLKALLQVAGKVQQSGKAVTADDIENDVERAIAKGTRMIGNIRTGSYGRKITFIHPKSMNGVLTEFCQAPPESIQ